MALASTVNVPPKDREILTFWTRSTSLKAGLAQRARIVLLAAEGYSIAEIVRRVGVSKPTVIAWRRRYATEGLAGLDDRPKPGRKPVIDEAQIVVRTLEPPPDRLGVAHWSSRLLAAESRPVARDHRQGLEEVETAALAVRDVQVLHRP
jgi:transposase-like protein